MDREKLFEDFLSQCKKWQEICGQGNPNADILIIGKEPYCKKVIDPMKDRQEYLKHLDENYKHCRVNCFVRKTCKNFDYYKQKYQDYNVDQKSFMELTTWSNYQTLLYEIYKGVKYHEEDKNIIDFERFAYTTELSSMPRPQADYDAAKGMINKRLLFFKESEFIQSFPVIILACREYIHNRNDDDRQIDNTFHVKYDGDETGKHDIGSGFWFYTHHSDDGSKKQLVIHTRQFSHLYNKSNDFIVGIAGVVREHLNIE